MKTLKQIMSESDYADPKSPGDKAFVDKHIIQKTDAPHKPKGGSNDEVFSGSKQKKKKRIADPEEGDDKKVYEDKMSKDDMSKKENIVKGMKKNSADFIKRYGKDAESVMHATANKMAQEESVLESVINATEDKIITVENKEFKLTYIDAQSLKKIYEDLNDKNKEEFEAKLETKIGTQQLISFASQWGE